MRLADADWETVLARFPNAERPAASFVRFTDKLEYIPTVVACLQDMGLDVNASTDGSAYEITSKLEQAENAAVSEYVCKVQFPKDPAKNVPLGNRQIEVLYDYFVEELTSCLEAKGYSIAPAPSKQVFLESWPDSGWNPYFSVDTSIPSVVEPLELDCPPTPSSLN